MKHQNILKIRNKIINTNNRVMPHGLSFSRNKEMIMKQKQLGQKLL